MSWFSEKTPQVARAYSELRNSVCKEGALDQRTKEFRSAAASMLYEMWALYADTCTARKETGAADEMRTEAAIRAMFVAVGSQLSSSEVYENLLGKGCTDKTKTEESVGCR